MIEVYSEDEALTPEEEAGIRTACETALAMEGAAGDIMICRSRAVEQAAEYGHSLSRELAFLAVHGTLHILGYDHMNEAEEQLMRARQRTILERIGETR